MYVPVHITILHNYVINSRVTSLREITSDDVISQINPLFEVAYVDSLERDFYCLL